MNVVRLTSHFPSPSKLLYGLELTVYHLSREQVQLGINVHIICKRYPQQKNFEKIEGINVHRVASPYNVLAPFNLLKLSTQTKIDIIHTHATTGISYALLQKLLRKKWIKAVHIAHVHGTTKGILYAWNKIPSDVVGEEMVSGRIRRYISIIRESAVWRGADAIITNSEFLKKELGNIYDIPEGRIHVVYNGVDLQTFYSRNSRDAILKRHGLDSRCRIILYLGGFRPVKGPLYFIRALEKIQKEDKNVKALFVGGKHPLDKYYNEAMMKLTRNLRKSNTIRIIENIPHVQLPDYYSAVDAVVVPSIYDAFPKVILEAMACGTPIVASAVGGIPELIDHGKTGILVKPSNPDELAEAITAIVSDYDLRNKISSNAKKMVEERFTWEHVAKNTLAVYERLLGYVANDS